MALLWSYCAMPSTSAMMSSAHPQMGSHLVKGNACTILPRTLKMLQRILCERMYIQLSKERLAVKHLFEGDAGARKHVRGREPAAGAGHGETRALPAGARQPHAQQQLIRRRHLRAALGESRLPFLPHLHACNKNLSFQLRRRPPSRPVPRGCTH